MRHPQAIRNMGQELSRKIRAKGRSLLVFCTRAISKDRKLNKAVQKREPPKNRKRIGTKVWDSNSTIQ